MESKQKLQCSKRLALGLLGIGGSMCIHLIIGFLYQWGIINIYITSYYKILDPTVTIENNVIAFPIMMLCIGLTMRLGIMLADLTSPILTIGVSVICQATLIFSSSYVPTIGGFIGLYGVIFGFFSGINFMVPIVQCNKYFPGYKMYINGIILLSTGLGSVLFGLFSYNFLNPDKIPSLKGYYNGTPELQAIASKVPECLRWLSLLILVIGLAGTAMASYLCVQNRRKQNQQKEEQLKNKQQQINKSHPQDFVINSKVAPQNSEIVLERSIDGLKNATPSVQPIKLENSNTNKEQKQKKNPVSAVEPVAYPETLKQAICTKICWVSMSIIFFGTCGVFMISGNYKNYVKNYINDDQMLTIIGVIGSVGNGVSRFFWNVLFNHTGYKFAVVLNLSIQIIIFATIRFTVHTMGAYLFLVLLNGICMGGFLVLTPTYLQVVFGQKTGSNLYGIFWEVFGLTNLLQYGFVAGLSPLITFDGIIYICLGMSAISLCIVIFADFEAPWKNPTNLLGYCLKCSKRQQK